MRRRALVSILLVLAPGVALGAPPLRPVESFAGIADSKQRAQALFSEAARVLLHPRCANCHPAGDVPVQGEAGRAHDPPVTRGGDDRGVPAMRCGGCHQERNLAYARVPGAPDWRLAPRKMAWLGQSPRAICEQLKDRARNGGRSLEQIGEHVAHDALVAWGWAPGADRAPAPGTQAQLASLIDAWRKAGAHCPEDPRP
jgi:hypothetical protein